MNIINRLLNKKKYYLGLFGILFLYFVITLILWNKIPSRIYLPLRWDFVRQVGFYPKNMQNVIYVFIIPLIGVLVIQLANMSILTNQNDLFSKTISKLLDSICYLLVIMGPLAFLICSFTQNEFLSYYFYLFSIVILAVNILIFRDRWRKGKAE